MDSRPLTSPETLIGAFVHSMKLSPIMISTCVVFLVGPTTLTFSILPFSPDKVTVSSQAYWPGCEIFFKTLSSYHLPNNFSTSACER